MSAETKKPLLSDERIAEVMGKEFIEGFNDYKVACGSARAVRNIYEAHLDRRDALIQEAREALMKALVHLDPPVEVTAVYYPPSTGLRRAADAIEQREADIAEIKALVIKISTTDTQGK